MKKIFIGVLSLVAVCSLASCNQGTQSSEGEFMPIEDIIEMAKNKYYILWLTP